MHRMSRTDKITDGTRKRIKGEKDAARGRRAHMMLMFARLIETRKRVAARKLRELLAGMTPEGREAYRMHQQMIEAGAGA